MRTNKTHNLKNLFPNIVDEWDFEKNTILPENVAPKSGLKVWWVCKNGHKWQAVIKDRHKYGCPYCVGQKVCKDNCLETANPPFLKEWSSKNLKSPKDYTSKSNQEAWWVCEKGHEWKAVIYMRYKHSCPYCSGRRATEETSLCNFPNLIKEWSSKNNLDPKEVSAHSHKVVFWECENKHIWEATVKSRHIAGCPYCSGRLATEEKNISLNEDLMKEWSPKNKVDPKNITPSSHTPVWWVCENNHEWKQSPNGRKTKQCPFCSKQRPSKDYNLETERPEIAELWHPKNKITPRDVLPYSNKKVWWKCSCGNEYIKEISKCDVKCPKCSRRVSKSSKEWLDSININKREHFIRVDKKFFYVDGFDKETNTIYEFLGSYWHGDPRIYHPCAENASIKKSFGTLLYYTIKRLNILCGFYKIIYKWEKEGVGKEYLFIEQTKNDIIEKALLLYKGDLDILEILIKGE